MREMKGRCKTGHVQQSEAFGHQVASAVLRGAAHSPAPGSGRSQAASLAAGSSPAPYGEIHPAWAWGVRGQAASAQPSPGRKAAGRGGSHTARHGAFLLQTGRGAAQSPARWSGVERARGAGAESDGGRAGSARPSLPPRGLTALPAALPGRHPCRDAAVLGGRWCGEGLPSPLAVLLVGDRGPSSPSPGQCPLRLRALPLLLPHLPPAMGDENPGCSMAGDTSPGHFPCLTHRMPRGELPALQPAQLTCGVWCGRQGACSRPGSEPKAGRTAGSQPWGSPHPLAPEWGGTSRDHRSLMPALIPPPELPQPLLIPNRGARRAAPGGRGGGCRKRGRRWAMDGAGGGQHCGARGWAGWQCIAVAVTDCAVLYGEAGGGSLSITGLLGG